ncbi:MAG: hypothetical protein WC307_02455 [Candidatus Nanoarchaeia archaeon]|jgi:hypothetical protein
MEVIVDIFDPSKQEFIIGDRRLPSYFVGNVIGHLKGYKLLGDDSVQQMLPLLNEIELNMYKTLDDKTTQLRFLASKLVEKLTFFGSYDERVIILEDFINSECDMYVKKLRIDDQTKKELKRLMALTR